jgi:GAF domain-containing protein
MAAAPVLIAYNFDMQAISPSREAWFLEALASLDQAGKAVSLIGSGETARLEETLTLIAQSAQHLSAATWSSIVPIDPDTQIPDFQKRIHAGEDISAFPEKFVLHSFREQIPIFTYNRPAGIHFIEEPTLACFPLNAEGTPVGALVVATASQVPISPEAKLCLENLANLAAVAIHQVGRLTGIQQDLTQKEEELKQLRRAGLLISSRLQLDETLAAILEMALEVSNAHYGIFRLIDKTGQRLITRAVAGETLNRPLVDALPINANSVMGWVARNRQAVCIPDLREEPWRSVYYPLDPALEMRSELAVPIISASGRLEGVLNLESPQVGEFGERDSHLIQSLATHAVIAIQEVRLLDALQEVAQLLLSQPSQKVLARLVVLACDLLNADSSAIWIRKEDELALQAAFGSPNPRERPGMADSLAGQVVTTRAAWAVPGSTNWPYSDLNVVDGLISALAVPLQAGGKNLPPSGVLAVFSVKNEATHFA